MIKYIEGDTQVTFLEVPDEISLTINISNCQCKCVGCHSPYLRENIGDELTEDEIDELISKNDGITCVTLMGEGNDKESLKKIMHYTQVEKMLLIVISILNILIILKSVLI